MAADLDEHVEQFRHRPLADAGPFTFVAADALTMKVREGGRVINAVVLVATGVNDDGHREVLGVRVATSETGAAWNSFFADLVARGLTGVRLVTSDAHQGLVEAIAANLPGASWQRCRTHYAANLMSVMSEEHVAGSEGDAALRLRPTRRRQPSTPSSTGCWTTSKTSSPTPTTTSTPPAPTSSRSPRSPMGSGHRSGRTTRTSASTARSAAAPTPSASSPIATRSSAWSEPSSPSRPTNGPKDAATSASTSSPKAASTSSPTSATRSGHRHRSRTQRLTTHTEGSPPLHHYRGLDRPAQTPENLQRVLAESSPQHPRCSSDEQSSDPVELLSAYPVVLTSIQPPPFQDYVEAKLSWNLL